ncbi:MAG: ATP-binding protein [Clostridiales bacterium]|nr:ATP-binding protein [Clostridiales bacterium]
MTKISDKKELPHFETIWANVDCGISLIDAETRKIIDINPVAVRMFGGDKADLIGKRCHNFVCPAEEDSCPIMDLRQKVDRSERWFIKSNGEIIPILKTVAQISYNGRLTLLESFSDISNLKKAEEQLRLMSIAKQANQAKSDFLSRMSHEMRTPMNAIIGMSKIAENTEDVEKLKYCLATISQSSTHLLSLINDILDMSKIEAGKFDLHSTTLNVQDVLNKIYNLVVEQTEEKGLKLDMFLDRSACLEYIGDELRLAQVITNLLSNAVKFTPTNGEIIVKVWETERREEDSTVQFEIEDTGIGMTAEQVSKLFNAFEQADTSISRRFGGTGLGLAISKNIVEMMQGKMWVESTLGKGSTFSFNVKLGHAKFAKDNCRETNIRGLRVLIASNDSRVCDCFQSLISGCGIVLETALSMEDLINMVHQAYINKEKHDAVFVDYNLGYNDVFAVLKRLHNKTKIGAMVIITSFLTWNKLDAKTRGDGFNRFLPLPLLPANIIKSLQEGKIITREAAAKEHEQKLPTAPKAQKPDFSKITLLVAEDIDINREILETLLADTKIHIDNAENGLVAVKKFTQDPEKYDMIIMDIHMPEMDGFEATRQIRSLKTSYANAIPIVAMTADVFQEDVNKCLASGMDDHLGKPINYDEVIRMISTYAIWR